MLEEFLLENLRELREYKGLKQKDMAKILNVSRPNYTRWETRAEIIPLRKLNELCNYFKVDMDYIIGFKRKAKIMHDDNVLDKKAIGENIRKLRHKYNLSQNDLADILNTTHSVISAYENGKTLILTAFLIEICEKYHESMDEICNRK